MSWPLHGLVLTTPDLVLRGMTEADALALGSAAPDDLGRDPDRPSVGYDVEQAYWRALGTWQIDDWVLPFTVVHEDTPVGVQALEGKHFPLLRVVDSYSWLVPSVRGRGLAKQMRAAVLELAFAHLGAQRAISEAWEDNVTSLGVSWRLGYAENGMDTMRRDGGVGHMQRVRLDVRDWICPYPVTVSGLEPCLALFGLGDAT